MKKRICSILLCAAMLLSLLPAMELPALAAGGEGSKNISNTGTDTFEALGFNADTSEVANEAASGKSPTGLGAFAMRTTPELLVSGRNAGGTRLYDYGATTPGMNFNSNDSSGYMHNLRAVTSSTAYTGSLPTNYDYVKSLAFDPTGSGKDDHVAYIYGTNNGNYSNFVLYVVDKTGLVSAAYPLGTAPFTLRSHQADAYMPLAAGDYDGDGKQELAVYCFSDSNAEKQWGSTTVSTYRTDSSGNALDNLYRPIDIEHYLINSVSDTTRMQADANGNLIDKDGYLVAWDGSTGAYVYIDADGNVLDDQTQPTVGIATQDKVAGDPVGTTTTGYDDENLDVRVLDVTVEGSGIAITRTTRSSATGGSITVEYDLSSLGFSKMTVIENINEIPYNGNERHNQKLYPIIDLSTVEQPGDEYDDLVMCISRANYSTYTTAEAATRTLFWIDPGSATGAKTQTFSGIWYHAADYGNSGSAAYSAEMMAFGGTSQANLNGDADGYQEVVVAGYRYVNTNTTLRLSSLGDDPGGDNNPFKMDDSNGNTSYYLAATYSYNAASRSYGSDGPATWVLVDDGPYNDSTNLREHIYDDNSIRDIVFAPLEVLGFAEKGTGYADSVFINGFVCDYYLAESGGGVGALPYSFWNNLRSSTFSARGGNFLYVSYAVPTNYVIVKSDKSRDGKTDPWQRWIGDAVAGNFDGDASGTEELYFTYLRNDQKSGDGYPGQETSATLIAVQKKVPGKLSDTSDLYDGNLNIKKGSSIYNEHDTEKSKYYSFSANDLWMDAVRTGLVCLAAPDWDNDSILARASTKAPEYYFSDPNVIAVLQSAPYFEELSADYDFYPSNGSTAIEREEGATHSGSAGFEVSAGLIVGMQAEIKPLGIPVGEAESTTTVSASLSMEYYHDSTTSYSTAFTSMVGTDMVALTMTPYVRYYYDVYDPESGGWVTGAMTLDMPKTPRTTMTSVETYDRVAEYSGWERIRGNILTNTPGDPYSYATTSSGLSGFEGGKTLMGSSGNNWVGVGTGGTSSVGNITQTISSEKTNGFTVTVGATVEREDKATVFGVTAGYTASAGVTAGYGYATFTGMSFSGTVDNLPQDAAAGYDFLWRFGCWKDSLSYTTSSGKADSNSVYVLGYLVKDVTSLPKPPQDLSVVNFTENSITLEWSHPNVKPVSYIIYREESGGFVPLQIVRASSSGDTQQYIDATCEPGTDYRYVVSSVRYVNGFEAKGPNSPAANGKTLSSDVPKVTITPTDPSVQSGDNVTLTATVTPVAGGAAPTVQWQKWNGERYVNLNGESGTDYTMLNVTDELDGSRYRCYVTQTVNGKWKVGYSVYAELTVTKRTSETTLAEVNASYAVDGTVNLSATVKEPGTTTPLTDGSVVFSVFNTSNGSIYNLKESLNDTGTAASSFKPTTPGIYTVSARYLGTEVHAGSESAEQTFTVYDSNGLVLMIDCASEMTYGDTLPLTAKLVDTSGTEAEASGATYKVTDEASFGSLTTSVATDSRFDPITASNSLFSKRNGQQRGYNNACGNYVIQATYIDGATTYTATKLVTVKPKVLIITVGNKTIANFSTTTIDNTYLNDVTPSYDGIIASDSSANYQALFEVYTDTAYDALYVGDHAIKLRYKDEAASGLLNYSTVVAQLLANYEVKYQPGTLSVTDDWYTVTYSVTSGEGELDARTASRAALRSSTQVLKGTPLTFAASPDVGYEVESWTATNNINVDNYSDTQRGNVTETTDVKVAFAVSYPQLSWSVVGGNGSLTLPNSAFSPANVSALGSYTFTARPDSGYMVSQWAVDGQVKKNEDGSVYQGATLTLNGLTGDTAVTVSFEKSVYYIVTATGIDSRGASLGSVSVTPGKGSVLEGTALTFAANAPSGYMVSQWRQYTDATNYTVLQYNVPSYSIASLGADADIRVVFVQEFKYKLSFGVNSPAMGGITAEHAGTALDSDKIYFAGIPVTFTVTPIDGYRIQSVTTTDPANPTLTAVSTAANGTATYSLTLNKAITVTANLESKGSKYAVTVNSGIGDGSYYAGDTVAITADAAPSGQVFSHWTSADGVTFANASSASTTFLMPGKVVTVTAIYTTPGGGGGAPGGGDGESENTSILNTVDHISYVSGYTDGSFRPGNSITRAEVAMMFYRLLNDLNAGNVKQFTDVDSGAWYGAAVEKLAGLGILAGYSDGSFRPEKTITRGEFVTMAVRFSKLVEGENRFRDISSDYWAYDYIVSATTQGWINGYTDGTFRPGSSITRAEVTVIVNRMLGRAADKAFVDGNAIRGFSDVAKTYWAYYDIMEAASAHDYTKDSGGAEEWSALR